MKKIILALAALTLGSQALAAPTNPPPLDPTKSIVDAADLLTPDQEAQVEAQTRQIYDTTHHHIVVLTMPTLNGQDVRQYINNAFRFYKIGNKTRNDGVLLLISMKDPRRLQIEVGYGLEGVLTDAISPQITERMKPLMKSGEYFGAVTQGVQDIADVITEEVVTPQKLAETKGNPRTAVEKAEGSDTLLSILVILGLLSVSAGLFYLFIVRPKRLRREAAELEEARQRAIEEEKERNRRIAESNRAREAARLVREAEEREAARRPTIIDRARDTFTKPTSSRSVSTPTPKRDDGSAARAAAAIAEADRQRRSQEQADRARRSREDEDRRRRDREDQERKDRDSWSSSSSSSGWGSSSSSSSSYDSGSSSSSYDSGGSSGGGGGGSDW